MRHTEWTRFSKRSLPGLAESRWDFWPARNGVREQAGGNHRELAAVNQEMRDNLERLTKAERMYAVAQLSASLAHEIRNPLASISGAAGILKRGNASAENERECLEVIEKESNRLNKLLANFLNFARPRAPRFQPTDLAAVIDSTIALARHSGEASGMEFRRTIDGAAARSAMRFRTTQAGAVELADERGPCDRKGRHRSAGIRARGSAFMRFATKAPASRRIRRTGFSSRSSRPKPTAADLALQLPVRSSSSTVGC